MCKTEESPSYRKDSGNIVSLGNNPGVSVNPGGVLTTASEPLFDALASDVKKSSELWHIHGKHFDLSGFLKDHPGGSSILEAVRGSEDITPLFESYHALAHTAAIRQSLEKFEWTGKLVDDVAEREAALVGGLGKLPIRYRWDDGGFYTVLKTRVKRHFLEKHGVGGVDPRKASVTRFIKAPLSWYLKEFLILAVYVPLFAYMLGFDFLRLGASLTGWRRAGAGLLAGALLQSFSFCTLHDASHFGIWFKRPRAQEMLSRVCNAWTLWHHGLWVMHHVYGHHSFTGDPERDPDLVHARPYIRKSIRSPTDQYDPFLVRWQRVLAPLFMMVLPGATLGQTQAYLRASREGHLWHVSVPGASEGTRWYEYITYVLALGFHVIGGNILVTFSYFMGISMAYHLCVAPDHDTFESSVLNSIETKRDGGELLKIGGVHVASSLAEPPPSALATATTVLAVEAGTAIEQEVGATPGAASLAEGFRLSSVVGRDSAEHTVVHGHDNGRPSKSSCSPSSDENAKAGQGIRNLAQGERDEEDEYAGVKGAEINSRRSPVSDGKDSRRGGIDASALQGLGEAAAVGESVSSVDDEEEDDGDDWGEVQVRHSGNFSNGNPLVTQAMGGINYQIEHHLFPSVSHMLYREIAPIVREACREFCIPYNAHPSLWSAYRSCLKHLVLCSEVTVSSA